MNIIQKSPSEYILIDAGLALDPDGDAITRPGKVVGTRAYLSPDQITLPQKDLDIRSDLFCLGIALYECATGRHPFWNDETPKGEIVHNILNFECLSPLHFNPDLPAALSSVVVRLLRKNRNERYRGQRDLRRDLRKVAREWGDPRSPKRRTVEERPAKGKPVPTRSRRGSRRGS